MSLQAKIAVAMLCLMVAGPAAAVDMDFYTYNGFSETVAAFRRLSLMMSDNAFLVFAAVFAIAGVSFGALSTGFKGMSGEQVNPVAFFIPVAVGLALFKGAVLPTGTVHVYDPVRNAYEPVGDVPDLIVVIAGGLNKIERGIIEIADTASANPYSDNAGAINFALIKAATSAEVKDWYLQQSLVNYYISCGGPYMGTSDTGARQRLMHASTDLMNEFAQWTNAALSTVYHPPGDDRGETRSCTDAWSGTGGLASRVVDPVTFADVTASICRQAGFNVADGAQDAKCKSLLQESTELYNVTPGSELPFLRSVLLAGAVSRAMNSADVDRSMRSLVNRQVMAEGLGNAEAMGQWIPKVRAFMLAVVLGVVPLTLLFLVTPLFKPALMLTIGLFAWLALWGIGDGIAVQMAYDAAFEAFNEIRRQQLGVEAIMMSPEGSVQALGIFGKSRSTALAMASVLAFGLFKFGGYALTGLGQQWQNNIENAGDQAGRQQLLPEQNAQVQQSMMGVAGTMGQAASGFRQGSLASGMGQVRQTAEAGAYIDPSISGGRTAGEVLGDTGRYTASDTLGSVSGTQAGAGQAGVSPELFRSTNAESQAAMGGLETFSRRAEADQTFGRANFGEGAIQRGVQTNAADVALSREDKGDLYTAAGVDTRSRVEAATTLTEKFGDNAATRAGQAEGLFRGAQSEGTLRAVDAFGGGVQPLITAEEVARSQHLSRGDAIESLNPGNIRATTDAVANHQETDALARANVGSQLARQLGLDPADVRQRLDMAEYQNGQVGLAVTDQNRGAIADFMERSGAMGPRELAELRESGGGFLRMTLDPNTGRADAAQADFVSSVAKGNITTETDGRTTRWGDNLHLGDVVRQGNSSHVGDVDRRGNEQVFSESLQISDPNSMRLGLAQTTLAGIAGDLTGGLDERQIVAVAGAYAGRLASEGYGGSAGNSESEITTAGGGISGGSALGTMLRKLGVDASLSANNQSAETRGASENYVLTGFAGDILPNLQDSQRAVYSQMGTPDTWSPEQRVEAEQAIADQWARRNEADLQTYKAGLVRGTAVAAAKAHEDGSEPDFHQRHIAGTWADKGYQYIDGLFK